MKQNRFLEIYSKFLQKFLDPKKPLKVVFDCPNVVAKNIIRKSFQKSKIKVFFEKNKADLNISFDIDADRAVFIDNLGRAVDPDVIARLLIWRLRPKKIVIDVRAGWLLRKLKTKNLKLKTIESQIGHSFFERKMVSRQADFGAEHSGHYYFKKFFYLDSGILAAIEVINAVSRLPYKFSDFVDLLPLSYRREINFHLNQLKYKTPASLFKKIERVYKKQVVKVSHLDELRMEFSDWWFNLHLSETESLLRLNIEALEKSQLQKQVFKLKKTILK